MPYINSGSAEDQTNVVKRLREEPYSFICSRDIRDHLKNIRYVFSDRDIAYLIWHCGNVSLEERHQAWIRLIGAVGIAAEDKRSMRSLTLTALSFPARSKRENIRKRSAEKEYSQINRCALSGQDMIPPTGHSRNASASTETVKKASSVSPYSIWKQPRDPISRTL